MEERRYEIPENAYIHGDEVPQFIYIQVPMDLVVSECFSQISGEAKILYGLLLNRTGLSVKNGWEDEKGRTYIYYTINDVMQELHISKATACRLFSELTNIVSIGIDEGGNEIWCGLIEKVRALNKPSKIYVHKVDEIRRIIEDKETFGQIVQKINDEPLEDHTNTGGLKNETTDVSDMRPRTSKKRDHGRLKNETTDVSDMRPWTSQKRDENNNYINNNYVSNNYLINHINEDEKDVQTDIIEKVEITREMIRDSIEYDVLSTDKRINKKILDELIELMVEVCVFESDLKIGGRLVPHSMVESRFEKYDRFTMEYILGSLSENRSDVKNAKQYLLTVLYNAPVTMESHIKLMVQHDMNS